MTTIEVTVDRCDRRFIFVSVSFRGRYTARVKEHPMLCTRRTARKSRKERQVCHASMVYKTRCGSIDTVVGVTSVGAHRELRRPPSGVSESNRDLSSIVGPRSSTNWPRACELIGRTHD